jgi:hypothetical protein
VAWARPITERETDGLERSIRKLEIGVPPAVLSETRMLQDGRRLIRSKSNLSPQGEKNDFKSIRIKSTEKRLMMSGEAKRDDESSS